MDFAYKFPVVRGIQAGREYYIAMIPMRMLGRLFPNEDEFVLPEYRAQRKLNESRIPIISQYITENRDSYVFSALAASIDGDFKFLSSNDSSDIGILEVSMDARFLINDGQHRKAAILDAINEEPDLGNETISVVLYEDSGLSRSQQIFTDLNKHAVKTSNSIAELYDSRDDIAVITRSVVSKVSFLNEYTDKEKDNLGKYSSNLFTLNTFYSSIKTSVYKGYKRDKIEMRGDRAEISDFPLYLNTVAGGLDCRDQTIGGFSFVVKIYAVPVVEIIGQLLYLLGRYGFNAQFSDCL